MRRMLDEEQVKKLISENSGQSGENIYQALGYTYNSDLKVGDNQISLDDGFANIILNTESNNILLLQEGVYQSNNNVPLKVENGIIDIIGNLTGTDEIWNIPIRKIPAGTKLVLSAGFTPGLNKEASWLSIVNNKSSVVEQNNKAFNWTESGTSTLDIRKFTTKEDCNFLRLQVVSVKPKIIKPHIELGDQASPNWEPASPDKAEVNITIGNRNYNVKNNMLIPLTKSDAIVSISNIAPNSLSIRSSILSLDGKEEKKENVYLKNLFPVIENQTVDSKGYGYNSGSHIEVKVSEGEEYLITGTSEWADIDYYSPLASAVSGRNVIQEWGVPESRNTHNAYYNMKIVIPKGATTLYVSSFRSYGAGHPVIFKIEEYTKTSFSGLTGLFLGDSIMQGYGADISSTIQKNIKPLESAYEVCTNILQCKKTYNGAIGGAGKKEFNDICNAFKTNDWTTVNQIVNNFVASLPECSYVKDNWEEIKTLKIQDMDFVVLLYGGNNWNAGATPDEMVAGLKSGIDILQELNPTLKIYILSPSFRFNKDDKTDSDTWTGRYSQVLSLKEWITQYKAKIEALHIPFCDCYNNAGITHANMLQVIDAQDGIHPNPKGAYLLGRLWAGFILNH